MTKASAIIFFKEIMFIEEPANKRLYSRIFVTSSNLHNMLTKRFGQINATARQIDRWLSADGSWGDKTTSRLNKVLCEGRWLWTMNDDCVGMKIISETGMIGNLTVYLYFEATFSVDISKQYKMHLKSNIMTTIGYIRKSNIKESNTSRC
jgi:hypothetical protein